MMFVPRKIISNERVIHLLLNVTSGKEDPNKQKSEEEGYLLMMRCEGGSDHVKECPRWKGEVVYVELTAEKVIALSHIEVCSMIMYQHV